MDSFYDVSLIIVDKNCSTLLERCVRSCTAQTYPGRTYEIVLLHNGKNPDVEDIIDNYSRRRIISSFVTDMKPKEILQAAMKHSTGRFLVFVESDDFISDYMLLVQTIFLYDNPTFSGVLVDYWLVDIENDNKLSRVSANDKPIFKGMMFKKDLFVRLSHSEGPELIYDPEKLLEIIKRNTSIGYLPMSFYRKATNTLSIKTDVSKVDE